MKYRDEDDKCFGVVGMAIGLTIWNADEMFTQISIDAEGFDCITFTSDYYFAGNPAISPKTAWKNLTDNYKITMGIVLANVMCRKIVGDNKGVDKATRNELLKIIMEEGKHSCQLDNDEIERLFDKSYDYLSQLFTHYQVKPLITDFKSTLKTRRTLTCHEVAEQLNFLHQ